MVQLFGALGAGLAILLVLAAWRLSSGPISLAFLSPYIEKALSAEDGSFGVRLDDTILTWAGWQRTLDVRVLNVRAVGPGGAAVAVIPELSLSLSVKALLKGMVAPKSIELFRPSLQVVRREDGSLTVGFGKGDQASDAVSRALLARLATAPDEVGPTGYLSRIAVRDADFFIVDRQLGTSWHAPNAEIKLRRDISGIEGEISLNLDMEPRMAHVTLLGSYQRAVRRLDFGVQFSDIVPAAFAGLSPQLKDLEALALPINGTLLVSMSVDGGVEAVDFDIKGGAGHVDLPAPVAQRLTVTGGSAKGLYRGEDHGLEVENLTLTLGDGGSLELPAAKGHRVPLRSLRAHVNMVVGGDRIDLVSLEAETDGPTVEATAHFKRDGAATRIRAEATLRNVPVAETGRYWPAAWGTDAHVWVTKNLQAGMLEEARASVEAIAGDNGDVTIVSLTGDMRLDDVTVDYLSPMTKAVHVSGTATFNQHRFDISIVRGQAAGLTTSEGHLTFTGLEKEDQYLDIDLMLHGPLQRALGLIDQKPLRLASKIDIDPKQSAGDSTTRLKLYFLLAKDLTVDQVTVSATARLRDGTVNNAILGHGISKANLDLRVDNKEMTVSGAVNLAGISGTLDWHRTFDDKAAIRTQYVLRGTVTDQQRAEGLGLNFAPFSREFISGPVGAEVRWDIQPSGKGRMRAKLDLSQARLSLSPFGWTKEPGTAGSAEIDVALQGERITAVPAFTIAARDLTARGSAAFQAGTEKLRRIDLTQMTLGRTDMSGALLPGADGGWTITVHGRSLDVAPIIADFFSFSSDRDKDDGAPGPNLSFAADLDQVWIGPDQMIRQVRGTLARGNGIWRAVTLSGLIKGGKTLSIRLEPGKEGGRDLSMLSNDAGETLRTFGYYPNMIGGQLDISGTFDDRIAGSPLTGRLAASDFRIIKAPVLTRLVSILALTGILDALRGQGLSFADLEVPFVRHEGVITLKDARVHGAALGFTASGKIFSHAEVMDIEGTLVPAYAINSALGNIPFLGTLFSGGEKGGGVFAATYKMTGPIEEPKVTVNPLTVLAPGFLRKLFGLFDADEPAPPALSDRLSPNFLAPQTQP